MRKIYSAVVALVAIIAMTFSANAANGVRGAKTLDASAVKSLNTKLTKSEKVAARFAKKAAAKSEAAGSLDEILGSYYSLLLLR